MSRSACAIAVALLLAAQASAQMATEPAQSNIPSLPETVVTAEPQADTEPPPTNRRAGVFNNPAFAQALAGRGYNLLGQTGSASQGQAGRGDLQYRPILRPAEALEVIPGLIATQHSGTGKANQYFLRGFNLDHGTDFALFVDGVPINLPTHAHGQGYMDINFIIPELIEVVEYKKGPYYAEVGDFGSAGAAEIRVARELQQSINKVEVGSYNYYRALVANSGDLGAGHLLYAFEANYYDGPWDLPQRFNRYNGLVKYTLGDDNFGCTVSGLAYHSEWDSTDQIPERAVTQGIISRLGNLDPTDGGVTTRIGGNVELWNRRTDTSLTKANAYATYYGLDLYSNFTFFLDDQVNGDQFQQHDRRTTMGVNLAHEWESLLVDDDMKHTVGLQTRHDNIPSVALYHTRQREQLSTTRNDIVNQTRFGLFYSNTTRWLDRVRTITGIRADGYRFDVSSQTQPLNSGVVPADIVSPKASLIFGPWASTEVFVNWGMGFHSNDARGTTITVDPNDPTVPLDSVPPLVRSQGYEVGVRTNAVEGLTTTLAVWYLRLDSELLFVGDAGTTEASRPSERYGVEWTNFYQLTPWLRMDADVAASQAQFTGDDPTLPGNYIPGAINVVFNSGPTITARNGMYTTFRLRYFGPRPLIEDGTVFSDATTLANMQIGYRRQRFWTGIDFFNLLGSTNNDIAYYYESQLATEAAPVNDIHFHPVEPFGLRFFANWMF